MAIILPASRLGRSPRGLSRYPTVPVAPSLMYRTGGEGGRDVVVDEITGHRLVASGGGTVRQLAWSAWGDLAVQFPSGGSIASSLIGTTGPAAMRTLAGEPFSIALWAFQLTDSVCAYLTVEQGTGFSVCMERFNGVLYATVSSNGGDNWQVATTIVVGEWNLLCCGYDGANTWSSVNDGARTSNANAGFALWPDPTTVYLGARHAGVDLGGDATIAEFAWWRGYSLRTEDVLRIYGTKGNPQRITWPGADRKFVSYPAAAPPATTSRVAMCCLV